MKYTVRRAALRPELEGKWEGQAWKDVEALTISSFRPESSDHRPETRVKLLYDDDGICGIYRVKDRYVRCVQTEFQSSVCEDSCVEFFVQPAGKREYFNFEFNCGGAMLVYYVDDPTRSGHGKGLKSYTRLTTEDCERVGIYHSMPRTVEPEIAEEAEWILEFFVPFSLLSKYAGPLGKVAGQEWRANFYKCGDETSHPHWASWAPVAKLNFHLPGCFETIVFEA